MIDFERSLDVLSAYMQKMAASLERRDRKRKRNREGVWRRKRTACVCVHDHDCVCLIVQKVTAHLFCLLTINSLEKPVSRKNGPLVCLGLNSDATAHHLCGLGQVTQPLWAHFLISKTGMIAYLTSEAAMKVKWGNICKGLRIVSGTITMKLLVLGSFFFKFSSSSPLVFPNPEDMPDVSVKSLPHEILRPL